MTDEPTTPAAERHNHPPFTEDGMRMLDCAACWPEPTKAELTLRCGDLRAQRDQARRERDEARVCGCVNVDGKPSGAACAQINEWYIQASDRLANVEAAIAPWPAGPHKGDILRALEDE